MPNKKSVQETVRNCSLSFFSDFLSRDDSGYKVGRANGPEVGSPKVDAPNVGRLDVNVVLAEGPFKSRAIAEI